MFTVREYTNADEGALLALARTQFTAVADEERAIERYLAHLLDEVTAGARIALADDAGTLVGFAVVSAPLTAEAADKPAETYVMISHLFVTPARRRNGIASALTRRAEQMAREAGASRVALKVLSDNTDAAAFYRRQSYREQFVVMNKVLSRKG